MKKNIIIVAIIIVATLIYIWEGYQKEEPSYLTFEVQFGTICSTINASGNLRSMQTVAVGSQVSGQIKSIYVEKGKSVKKGELIAEIDSTTQKNDLLIKCSLLESYKLQLEAKKIAKEIAQKKLKRELRLLQNDATSKENVDTAKNELAKATAEVAEMSSLVTQTEISVETAKINLGYTKIISPISGTVLFLSVEEGQTINASQTTPTIAYVADLNRMILNIKISEADITKVKPGMQVEFNILSMPEQKYKTKLMSIDPVNIGSESSLDKNKTIQDSDKAIYYNGQAIIDNAKGVLKINMTTLCTIVLEKKEGVVIIPYLSLIRDKNKFYVKILKPSGDIEYREISIGISDKMYIEVLSGLVVGERIILPQEQVN